MGIPQGARRRQNTAVTAAGSAPRQWAGREHDADIMLLRKHQPRLAQSCPVVRADRTDCPCDVGKPGTVPTLSPSVVSSSTPAGAGTRNPGQPTTTGATDATPPPRSVCSRGVLRAHVCAHPSDSRRRMRGTPRGRPELSVSSHPGYATTPPHARCAAITRKIPRRRRFTRGMRAHPHGRRHPMLVTHA